MTVIKASRGREWGNQSASCNHEHRNQLRTQEARKTVYHMGEKEEKNIKIYAPMTCTKLHYSRSFGAIEEGEKTRKNFILRNGRRDFSLSLHCRLVHSTIEQLGKQRKFLFKRCSKKVNSAE